MKATNRLKHHRDLVYVFVDGGVVQDIICENPQIEVVVIDFDVDGEDEGRLTKNGDEKAYVSHWAEVIGRKVTRAITRWLKDMRAYAPEIK